MHTVLRLSGGMLIGQVWVRMRTLANPTGMHPKRLKGYIALWRRGWGHHRHLLFLAAALMLTAPGGADREPVSLPPLPSRIFTATQQTPRCIARRHTLTRRRHLSPEYELVTAVILRLPSPRIKSSATQRRFSRRKRVLVPGKWISISLHHLDSSHVCYTCLSS